MVQTRKDIIPKMPEAETPQTFAGTNIQIPNANNPLKIEDITNKGINPAKSGGGSNVVFNPDKSVVVNGTTLTQDQYKDVLAVQRGTGTSLNPLVNQAVNPQGAQRSALAGQVGQNTQPQGNILANQGEGLMGTGTTLASGVGGALAGATGGALAAGIPTLGIGAPVGAAIGGIVGFVGGVLGKLTLSERQNVKNANKLATISKTNFGKIITRLNNDPTYSPAQAVMDFNEQEGNINLAYSHLKLENQGWKKGVSAGYDELVGLETWRQVNIPILRAAMQQAIMNPKIGTSISSLDLEVLNG